MEMIPWGFPHKCWVFEGFNSKRGIFELFLPWLLSQLLQVVVLITDGKSSDSVEEGARILQDLGVTVFAVGTCGP